VYQDKELVCNDCGGNFTFTSGEQSFYADKGFENEPTRCPECRAAKKRARGSKRRELHDAVCAECGCETQVPFKPTSGKPVYCRDCYRK